MDPSDCFTCSSTAGFWIQLGHQRPGSVFFVFTREPSEAEARLLRTYRVPLDHIVHRRGSSGPQRSERLYVNGQLVVADSGAQLLTDPRALRLFLSEPAQ